jgi:hypothetical protein
MKIQPFLQHHSIASNPFADEDAQTDLVFKLTCINNTFHPTWDKVYGDPSEPATAVVFGEKGSGKTAMRMQIAQQLTAYNADHPQRQAFVVAYDDFNPFLDRFRSRQSSRRRRRPERTLGQFRLWDHIDAILGLSVTQLVDRVLGAKHARHPAARDEIPDVSKLDRAQGRDLLLLAALYDQSTGDNPELRWRQLCRKLRFRVWTTKWDLALGIAATVVLFSAMAVLGLWQWWPWFAIAILAGWAPRAWRFLKCWWKARQIIGSTKTLNHFTHPLRRLLMNFASSQLVGQPLPTQPRTDDRYELLSKLQGVLRALGFGGIIVLIDRVDEPYMINGSTELMKALVWPLLDNKLLKHPGAGLKLLLPSELERLLDSEDRDFHQRARLDKQNLIRSLAWTGQSLYDLANSRIKACAAEGASPALADLFEPEIDSRRLMEAFAALRVPRQLFKFMYRLLTVHCNAHSDDSPVWKIPSGEFESVLALYLRDQEAFDRGASAG